MKVMTVNDKLADEFNLEAVGTNTPNPVADIRRPQTALEPIQPQPIAEIVTPEVTSVTDIKDDLQEARENAKALWGKIGEALDHAIQLTQASDSPRMVEVLNQTFQSALEINRQILDIQRQGTEIEAIKNKTNGAAGKNVTNNVLITTSDMLKQIERDRGERE